VDAVVNLAGENLFGGRWTAARRRRLVDSRVETTRRVVALIEALPRRPRVLVSASGIGFYGGRDNELIHEGTAQGYDFLAELCGQWEAEASRASALGLRVVNLRIGTVLGPEGGALLKLAPSFRWGLGARLGSGGQFLSWIHLRDLVELVTRALTDARYEGHLNAVAPGPVTNRVFTAALARTLGRRAFLAIPGLLLRLVLGAAAAVLLDSQRAVPRRLTEELGFAFRFGTLEAALDDIFGAVDGVSITSQGGGHLLRQTTTLDAPQERVFDFFSRAPNLGLLTPGWMDFEILGDVPDPPFEGARIAYRLRLGPLPLRWLTRITSWSPPARFADLQERGPYRLWHHEHRFAAVDDDRTRMDDEVRYALPLGPLGRLVHRLLVAPKLRRIFAYRAAAISLRFDGEVEAVRAAA
jgi:uncharacterized protein (TIGR01777 family)